MVETETKQEISQREFHLWVSSHCPRLLDGLLHWITSSLLLINLEGEEQGAESHGAESTVRQLIEYVYSGTSLELHIYLGWEKVSCLERCPQFNSVLIDVCNH